MSGSHPHPMRSHRKLPANRVYMLVSESAVKRKREINIFTVATDGRLSEMLAALAVSPHLWCFAAPVVSPHANRSARESGARNAYLCPLFSQRTRHGEHCVVRTRVVTNTACKYLVFGVHSKLMRPIGRWWSWRCSVLSDDRRPRRRKAAPHGAPDQKCMPLKPAF